MKSIDQVQLALNQLSGQLAWLTKYAPNSDIFVPNVGYETLLVFCYDSDRETKLTEVGQLLGTDGWTAIPETHSTRINWEKTIDGVLVKVCDAQGRPAQPSSWPVPPAAFPLQISDATPVREGTW